MAYRDDIALLNPDHHWVFDGANAADSIGSASGTVTGASAGSAICEDCANCIQTTGTGHRVAIPSTATINSSAQDRKAVGGWFRTSAIQPPPKSIYREGNNNNYFHFVMWGGNNVMLEVSNDAGVNVQAFSDFVFEPDRAYHLFGQVEGTAYDDFVRFYIDGVLQSVTEPVNGQLGAASLNARGVAEFGDASGSTFVGQASVLLNASVNGLYNHWAAWEGVNAQLSASQIREELFEKGALPGVTIVSDTQENMQLDLDALASTLRPNEPLNIRIEAVNGGGDLSLNADGITHNELASIHVQYVGVDTLNWTNSNGSNASIGSTPNGGTIRFINPVTLSASPLVIGSEIRFYEAGTNNELAGVESSGISFASLVAVDFVDVVIHKEDYEYISVKNIDMTTGDISLPVSQQFDRNYENL